MKHPIDKKDPKTPKIPWHQKLRDSISPIGNAIGEWFVNR